MHVPSRQAQLEFPTLSCALAATLATTSMMLLFSLEDLMSHLLSTNFSLCGLAANHLAA
jgi:hypothetical protein